MRSPGPKGEAEGATAQRFLPKQGCMRDLHLHQPGFRHSPLGRNQASSTACLQFWALLRSFLSPGLRLGGFTVLVSNHVCGALHIFDTLADQILIPVPGREC